MRLPEYAKPLPAFFSHLPWLKMYKGFLFISTIYFQREIYKNLQTKQPTHQNVGYLIHEETHHKRAKIKGLLGFGLPYLFSRKARFLEEFVAYKAQIEYLKSNNQPFNYEITARNLSGLPYLWCVSYEEAKKSLDSVWRNKK